jgi:hypothetical protein
MPFFLEMSTCSSIACKQEQMVRDGEREEE